MKHLRNLLLGVALGAVGLMGMNMAHPAPLPANPVVTVAETGPQDPHNAFKGLAVWAIAAAVDAEGHKMNEPGVYTLMTWYTKEDCEGALLGDETVIKDLNGYQQHENQAHGRDVTVTFYCFDLSLEPENPGDPA
jgi:hypothetical protein